jgi:hypothetical protein
MLFVNGHLDVVFEAEIKRADRRLECTQDPDRQLAAAESLSNGENEGEKHRDTQENPVDVIGVVQSQAHVDGHDTQRDDDKSAVINNLEIFPHPITLRRVSRHIMPAQGAWQSALWHLDLPSLRELLHWHVGSESIGGRKGRKLCAMESPLV